jgi:hypothetical protein
MGSPLKIKYSVELKSVTETDLSFLLIESVLQEIMFLFRFLEE